MVTLQSSQCQVMYTLYFYGPVHHSLTAVKCIYSRQFITKFALSRLLYGSKLEKSREIFQQTKQNTQIRTLNPDYIHSLINQLYVCVFMCLSICMYICI
jgi:hypothetical protein